MKNTGPGIGQTSCRMHIPTHLTNLIHFGFIGVIQTFQSDATEIEPTLKQSGHESWDGIRSLRRGVIQDPCWIWF